MSGNTHDPMRDAWRSVSIPGLKTNKEVVRDTKLKRNETRVKILNSRTVDGFVLRALASRWPLGLTMLELQEQAGFPPEETADAVRRFWRRREIVRRPDGTYVTTRAHRELREAA